MYTQDELKNVLKQYLESDEHRLIIRDLQEAWKHESHGPRRYAKLYEDDNLTAWLIGWRPGIDTVDHHVDTTPIHGHGNSSALVTTLEGEVDNVNFGEIPQDMLIGTGWMTSYERTVLHSGQSIWLPKNNVHIMSCDEKDGRGFGLTLHLYTPRLRTMTYYDQVWDKPNGAVPTTCLRLVDRWEDTDTDKLIPKDLMA